MCALLKADLGASGAGAEATFYQWRVLESGAWHSIGDIESSWVSVGK